MPFMTGFERSARKRELQNNMGLCLKLKFGEEGLRLLPEVLAIEDYEVLRSVFEAIETAARPDDLRRIWTRRRPKTGRRT
jgi:hypothetical protein